MKRSNKLLIITAILGLLIPILIVTIASAVAPKVPEQQLSTEELIKTKKYTDEISGFSKIPLNNAFKTITLLGTHNLYIEIYLIKSNDAGIRVKSNMQKNITTKTDANGQLLITVNGVLEEEQNGQYGGIIAIYGKQISDITLNKAEGISIITKQDSLVLNGNDVGRITLQGYQSIYKKNEGVNFISGNQIKHIVAYLKNSHLVADQISCESMNLDVQQSSIELTGNRSFSDIQNLMVRTNGNSGLNIEKTNIKSISGQISDSTVLVVPTPYLKQLFQNK
ncbi:hypothetical protein ACJVDH_00095 [Pedobacter sp. AW1-32]|uniref:hypothetical protein n=1 Tax=Pedobacter sp. AW1-32 TaxID=3383026 RepID=UPI003FF0038B